MHTIVLDHEDGCNLVMETEKTIGWIFKICNSYPQKSKFEFLEFGFPKYPQKSKFAFLECGFPKYPQNSKFEFLEFGTPIHKNQNFNLNLKEGQLEWQSIWQYWFWSFQGKDTKFERFLAENQLHQMKWLNFVLSKIGHHFKI